MLNFLINIIIKFFFCNYLKKKLKLSYVILYYHRVLEDKEFDKIIGPNKELCVRKSDFIDQMNLIKKKYYPISIEDIDKKFPTNKTKIIVTFDDGYKDNITVAYPILRKNKIPFTVYIISRIINGDTWVWWFELWQYLISRKNSFSLTENAKEFYNYKNILYKMSLKEQKTFFRKLTGKINRPSYKNLFLNYKDIIKLKKDSLCTIGSHTHDHLNLKEVNISKIDNEIFCSKKILEHKFNIKIKSFAYPYGFHKFSVMRLLKKYKYSNAVTTECYSNLSSIYLLPSISIGHNVNIGIFERKILGFDTFVKKYFYKIKFIVHA
jgi:peptidoglycan/xylan/chitin deacetylase (PgdA/CDA1 family)